MTAPQESSRRRAGIRFGVAVQIVLACVLLAAVNYAGFHYYFRGDWSPGRKYELGEITRKVLQQLPAPVTVYVFFSPTTAAPGYEIYSDLTDILKEYQFAGGDKITVELIDPMRNLARARELQAKFEFGTEENLVILESGGRSRQIRATDMAEYDRLAALTGEPPRVKAFRGEQLLTSAFMDLGEPEKRKIYFLQGQGEPPVGEGSPLSLLEEYIGRQGVAVAPLELAAGATVPADTGAVILAGPRYDPPETTLAALREYWGREGRLIVFLDPDADAPGLRAFLTEAGVRPRDDRVLRTVQLGVVTGILRDVTGRYSPDNRLTRRLTGVDAALPGATSSLELLTGTQGTLVEPLITAAEPFWGEMEHVTDAQKGVAFDADRDTPAPLVLAAMVERGGVADEKVDVGSARLVVTGNSEMIADGSITGPNLDFVLSALNWMLDRSHLAGITPKDVQAFNLSLTDLETGRIALYTLIVIPAAALVGGAFVWLRRRR